MLPHCSVSLHTNAAGDQRQYLTNSPENALLFAVRKGKMKPIFQWQSRASNGFALAFLCSFYYLFSETQASSTQRPYAKILWLRVTDGHFQVYWDMEQQDFNIQCLLILRTDKSERLCNLQILQTKRISLYNSFYFNCTL